MRRQGSMFYGSCAATMPAETLWVMDTSVIVGWFFRDDAQHAASLPIQQHLLDHPQHYVVPTFVHQALHAVLRLGQRAAAKLPAGLVITVQARALQLES